MTEFEDLFGLLWEDRQENLLEEALKNDEGYQNAVLQAGEEVKKMGAREASDLPDALDDLTAAYNYVSAEYGRIAYRQGLRDGVLLMKDIMGVFSSN